MAEHADRREVPRTAPTPFFREPGNSLGDEALEFTRWFAKSKYALMGAFLGELMDPSTRDVNELRKRYCRAVTHANRYNRVRGIVTFLLAIGVMAAAATGIANALDVDAPTGLLKSAVAASTSLTVLLVAVRLLLDRYLQRCDVAATFLAIQLATSSSRAAP